MDFETEDLAITISIQYVILAVTAFLIVINVQGFFRRLLVTLKNILRDNQIQISFHTTLLIFSFIMGTYYLSIVLSLSMQLPEDRRQPFARLLDKFSTDLVRYTFDCFFVLASILGGFLIWFDWLVKRVPT